MDFLMISLLILFIVIISASIGFLFIFGLKKKMFIFTLFSFVLAIFYYLLLLPIFEEGIIILILSFSLVMASIFNIILIDDYHHSRFKRKK